MTILWPDLGSTPLAMVFPIVLAAALAAVFVAYGIAWLALEWTHRQAWFVRWSDRRIVRRRLRQIARDRRRAYGETLIDHIRVTWDRPSNRPRF